MISYKCNNIAIAPGQIWSWTATANLYCKICVLGNTTKENIYKCLYLECAPRLNTKAGEIGNFVFQH